jgi:hypothetical protein
MVATHAHQVGSVHAPAGHVVLDRRRQSRALGSREARAFAPRESRRHGMETAPQGAAGVEKALRHKEGAPAVLAT